MISKKFWIPVLWTGLLLMGIPAQIVVWTSPTSPVWLDLLLSLPLAIACILLFRMIYDIWMFTEPFGKKSKFTEAPRVDLKTGGLIHVNGVLYRFTEISTTVDFNETNSRIILESVGDGRPFIETVRVPPPEEFNGPMVTPRDQDPDF